ncbi:hypothetical protein [Streptomyces pseudovenezuelae]|uniref:hypothetical protein n=1 Tax=Streptomyces pseudovenezuelae TaxID=67350 RepID=UPI003720C046
MGRARGFGAGGTGLLLRPLPSAWNVSCATRIASAHPGSRICLRISSPRLRDHHRAGLESPGERVVHVHDEHPHQARQDGPVRAPVEGQDGDVADPGASRF